MEVATMTQKVIATYDFLYLIFTQKQELVMMLSGAY